MKRKMLLLIALVIGIAAFIQGLNVIQEEIVRGHIAWALFGGAMVVVGLAEVILAVMVFTMTRPLAKKAGNV